MARKRQQSNEVDERAGRVNGTAGTSVVPIERIQSRILLIRGQKVILDSDLAELYGVPTKRLNEQVKRNSERFPPDFVSQIATTSKGSNSHLSCPMPSPSTAPSWPPASSIPPAPCRSASLS